MAIWLSFVCLCNPIYFCLCPVTAFQATTVTARRPSLNWAFETRTRLEVSEYPGQQNCIRSQILSRLRHILGMFICWDEERQSAHVQELSQPSIRLLWTMLSKRMGRIWSLVGVCFYFHWNTWKCPLPMLLSRLFFY